MTPADEPAEATCTQVRDRRASDARQERLAAALRENLFRRKEQARARNAAAKSGSSDAEPQQS